MCRSGSCLELSELQLHLRIPVHRFLRSAQGNVALTFALLAPVLMVMIGFGIDYAHWNNQKNHLQTAADAAAVAGASELYLANATLAQVESTVQAVGAANLKTQAAPDNPMPASFKTEIITNTGGLKVTATQGRKQFVSKILPMQLPPFTAIAVAQAQGGGKVCAVMLEPKENRTFFMTKRSRLSADGCAIYSNSTSPAGIYVHNSAKITAGLICSAGGTAGMPSNFSPKPETDCPAMDDPLAHRLKPKVGLCDETRLVLSGGTHTLSPGTYCNGLRITNGANVTLKPGIYRIKNGPVIVEKGGALSGKYTGFFFTGDYAGVQFMPNSHIDLKAPKQGKLAGLLFFEDRDETLEPKPLPLPILKKIPVKGQGNLLEVVVNTAVGEILWPTVDYGKKVFGKTVRDLIASDDARNLLGTIYFPNGLLHVAGKSPIADKSAYTIIVARKLRIDEGPDMVLNTGYDSTDVPVPNGVGPVDGTIALVN